MLTPPDGLSDEHLVSTLAARWRLDVAAMTYQPVGFGSHHWAVDDAGGGRWFLTVDDLAVKRHSPAEPQAAAFDRLRAALSAAVALREGGRTFVVAPHPALDGEPVVRVADRFGVALYPYVSGDRFQWGDALAPADRRAVLEMVVALHAAPGAVARHALVDDFAVPHRGDLEAACDPATPVDDCGPYAAPTAKLLTANAPAVNKLLDRYDDMVRTVRPHTSRYVLTHGEPHPGNTMRTADGWRLIDWETALMAPPERDLWLMDPGDGSILEAYAAATGVAPARDALDLYRLRWDIADMAVAVDGFRRPHTGTANDDMSWNILCGLVASLTAQE